MTGLVHHSDGGLQYLAICYTEPRDAAGAVRSVGSTGDSYNNAAAGSLIALYKTELIRRCGPSAASTTSNSRPWGTLTG